MSLCRIPVRAAAPQGAVEVVDVVPVAHARLVGLRPPPFDAGDRVVAGDDRQGGDQANHSVAGLGDTGVGQHALHVALENGHRGGDKDPCNCKQHQYFADVHGVEGKPDAEHGEEEAQQGLY